MKTAYCHGTANKKLSLCCVSSLWIFSVMFGRVSNNSKDKQQPAAKDENVRKESQLE